MPISEERCLELQELLADIFANESKLNDWEKGFVSDQQERFDKYGIKIFLSDKQWDTLVKIHKSVTEAGSR